MPNTVTNVDSATPLNPGGFTGKPLGVFGGESAGFASTLVEKTKTFYGDRLQADQLTVAKGMAETPIPRSIFNKYALFNFRGMHGGLTGAAVFNDYFDSPDNKSLGGGGAKRLSINTLIDFFDQSYPKIGYRAQDFLYLKYYKEIPVNHLVTLRRFPVPVNDNIFDLEVKYEEEIASPDPPKRGENQVEPPPPKIETADITQIAGVTAVTYLGETTGNKLDDILKFTYGLNWKEQKSEMESIDSGGGFTAQPFYNKIGKVGRATADAFKGVSSGGKFRAQQQTGGDRLGTTYANFVIGPVNVVNQTTIRDVGLKFANDIKLNFEYELKSLNYVNPKIAMLDIISNMLTMTTNNAQFFGGGQRYYGGGGYVKSAFGDMGKLKNGDFSGYIGSVVNDVNKGFKNVFAGPNGQIDFESALNGLVSTGKTALGNLLGGFFGANMGAIGGSQASAAFISAEPTGNWHLTVGNPLNPIVMMGNMYCDNTVMTLGNGLGYDDFPMEVKFEIDLKHGKPRDKGDIENMFNAGRGRIYASTADEDLLNLKGVDVATYGSVKTGKVNLQQTQSGAQVGDVKPENIKNTNGKTKTAGGTSSNEPTEVGSYVSNLISMMIDS